MSRNRDVFQVLATTGNQALAVEGTALEALLPGQIGIFSYSDNLAIDGAPIGDATNFYIAVGKGTGGVTTDILKSSGEFIPRQGIVGYSARCYTPEQPKVIELTNIKAKCDTEYGIKFELRNQQAYRTNGYNAVTKSFVVKSDCCDDCAEGCNTGNVFNLVADLVAEVNADTEKLILAQAIGSTGSLTVTAAATTNGNVTVTVAGVAKNVAVLAGDTAVIVAGKIAAALPAATANGNVVGISGTPGTVVFAAGGTGVTATTTPVTKAVVTDIPAFEAANPAATLGIRFTAAAGTVYNYSNINLAYFDPRATDLIPSLIMGFDCSGTLTTTQEIVYEEGAGYDLRQLEYFAGGWNGKPGPYRASTLMGLERAGFEYHVNPEGKYVTFYINYNNQSIGGWQHYTNHGATIVAIPSDAATTLTQFSAAMDLIVAGNLKPLNAYVADCPAVTVPNTSVSEGDNFQDATPGKY